MSFWRKWIFGSLGWAVGGPIGGIIGFALGSIGEEAAKVYKPESNPFGNRAQPSYILPNDFSAALMVLCASVMMADQKLMRSELDFVKSFFVKTFGKEHTQQRMALFREILKQDIPIGSVCQQIRNNVDHSGRLEMLHLLFGLAASDGEVSYDELAVIERIATLTGISGKDFLSIKAMFEDGPDKAYTILEIDSTASDEEVKKAYRKMAMKFHPDRVHHLGVEYQRDAQEKFRKINEAYEKIKKRRGIG